MVVTQKRSLSDDEGRLLLDLARRAAEARIHGRAQPELPELPERLRVSQGAFVTLRARGRLRGCIGIVAADRPLAETVTWCAAAAASEDARFLPLKSEDLPALSIEISALEPPFDVRQAADIILGCHGLIVSMGARRGLLLPQVALEHRWDLDTFLRETCRKAGLEPDAWRRGARIQAFEAQILSEESLTGAPPSSSRPASPPRSR